MFASLKSRMIRTLLVAVAPAGLGLALISNSFGQVNWQANSTQDPGPGGSGYCLAASNQIANDDDDGPGLGGGYALASAPGPVILDDGPGTNVPYL